MRNCFVDKMLKSILFLILSRRVSVSHPSGHGGNKPSAGKVQLARRIDVHPLMLFLTLLTIQRWLVTLVQASELLNLAY